MSAGRVGKRRIRDPDPVEITEVRVKLMGDNDDRLRAFCSITLDHEFVIRDLKIIDGQKGPFVAMPSRKLMLKCPSCSFKNEVRARYCQNCGAAQKSQPSNGAPTRIFADIAHPINSSCREKIQSAVLKALEAERVKASRPGYVCSYDEYDDFYNESKTSVPA